MKDTDAHIQRKDLIPYDDLDLEYMAATGIARTKMNSAAGADTAPAAFVDRSDPIPLHEIDFDITRRTLRVARKISSTPTDEGQE